LTTGAALAYASLQMRTLPVLFLLGCATQQSHPADPVAVTSPGDAPHPFAVKAAKQTPAPAPAAASRPADEPYGEAIHSVRFLKNTALLKHPRSDAGKVGIVRGGTFSG